MHAAGRGLHKPLVSIIIPTHNYGRFLSEAIESALAQTYKNIEILVVDDGSTDNTRHVVEKYPSVRYVYQKHSGVANAMNVGISLAKGEFFICLGADDKLHPDFTHKCIKEMLKGKRIGFVWTATQEFGESDKLRIPRLLHHRFSVLRGTGGQLGTALIRKKAFEEVGGYDEALPAFEDWDLAIRMYQKGWKGKPIFEPLHFTRVHEKRLTAKAEREKFHQYLEHKYPIMKLYVYVSRIFDFIVLFLTRPNIAVIRLWNKVICRIFKNEPLIKEEG
jgi:glycosyltransferase involved in cell wall biosynthesis